jgi:hypothetical protein
MITPTFEGAAEGRLAWLADQAAQTFADDPQAARAWLERPRRDLAGFTPAQCALLGGAPLHRVATLLARVAAPADGSIAPEGGMRPSHAALAPLG